MKIAVIAERYDIYSGSRAAIELSIALVNNTPIKEVIFIAYEYRPNTEAVLLLKKNHIPYYFLKLNNDSFWSKLLAGWQLFSLAKLKEMDILSFHGTFPLFIAARFIGKPLLYTYYGTQFDAYQERFTPNTRKDFFQYILNTIGNILTYLMQLIPIWLANEVVTISKYCEKEMLRLYKHPSRTIYIGVFFPQRKYFRKKSKPIQLISISRITPYKGFHHLIKVAADASHQTGIPTTLHIIGSSNQKHYLDFLRVIKNKTVTIHTFVTEKERMTLLSQSDIYVTADRYLFFGLPVVEAATFGLPTVTLNYCAANEVVYDKRTGFIVNNLEEFVKALSRLIKNDLLRQQMGSRARNFAQTQFHWKTSAAQYHKTFQELINYV